MTRPEDISERAWDEARLAVGEWCLAANLSGVDETIVTEGIARAIDAETARATAAERELWERRLASIKVKPLDMWEAMDAAAHRSPHV